MNMDEKSSRPRPKIRFIRYLFPLLCLGLAIAIFAPLIPLQDVVSVAQRTNLYLVALAAAAQTCSYLGSGYMLSTIANRGQKRLSVIRGTLITMAAASVGLVAGGWISATAMTYYWVAKINRVTEDAQVTALLPAVYNTVTLILVSFIGAAHLVSGHVLTNSQFAFYGSVLLVTILMMATILYGLLHRDKVKRLLLAVITPLAHVVKRDYDLFEAEAKIDLFYDAVQRLGNRAWLKPGLGSATNIAFDMLTLYLFFAAVGHSITPSILIAGYSIISLLSKSTFFVPGGAGVIEGGMVAIYISLGVSSDISVVAVLGYRIISFWLPSLMGFIIMFYLERSSHQES
jgi:uncharacterized protein (TIRG00374 family)